MNKLVIAFIALVALAGVIGGVLMLGNDREPATANASEPNDLAGTSWILEQMADADGMRPVVGGSQATLDFGTDGRVTGNATCNRYMGPYTQDGANVSMGMLASTMMACGEDALNAQEMAYMAALNAVERAVVDGATLTLSSAGGVELRFTQA